MLHPKIRGEVEFRAGTSDADVGGLIHPGSLWGNGLET